MSETGPVIDPVIQRKLDAEKKAKQKDDVKEKSQKQKDANHEAFVGYINDLLNTKLNSQTDYTVQETGALNPTPVNTFETTLKQLADDQKYILIYVKRNIDHGLKRDNRSLLPSKDELIKRFASNKEVLLNFVDQWETKNNKSILDVLSNPSPTTTKEGFWGNQTVPASETNDLNFLYELIGSNAKENRKFFQPTTFKPKDTIPTNDVFKDNPGGEGASNPVTGPGKIEQTVDDNGNPVYRWSKNTKGAVNIAFVGDKNGTYINTMAAADYDNAFAGAKLDSKSPMSLEGYYSKIAHDLMSTPGAVDKIKNLLITKHVIPPSAANSTMARQNEIDGTTSNAIRWAISAVTAHNVALFNLGKPNQKFMTLEDYINNMNPINVSSTETSNVYKQIQPKDYELAIDNMFQNSLGRGATENELKHFVGQLQSYASSHPESTTTTKTDTTTGSKSSSTVSGGVTDSAAGAMMRDEALANPEAEGYVKGAKFFNWFQQAIDAPVQLGG